MVIENNAVIEAEKMAEARKIEKALIAEKMIEARKIEKANVQNLFDRLFTETIRYTYGLDYDTDIPKAILKLENLIAQGANPNKRIIHAVDGSGYVDTPISYTFLACNNDSYIDDADGRNFYLEIIKLLIDNGVDWNAKNYYESEDTSGTTNYC